MVLLVLALGPPLQVLTLRIVPPPVTLLMLERMFEGRGLDKHWRPLGAIAPS